MLNSSTLCNKIYVRRTESFASFTNNVCVVQGTYGEPASCRKHRDTSDHTLATKHPVQNQTFAFVPDGNASPRLYVLHQRQFQHHGITADPCTSHARSVSYTHLDVYKRQATTSKVAVIIIIIITTICYFVVLQIPHTSSYLLQALAVLFSYDTQQFTPSRSLASSFLLPLFPQRLWGHIQSGPPFSSLWWQVFYPGFFIVYFIRPIYSFHPPTFPATQSYLSLLLTVHELKPSHHQSLIGFEFTCYTKLLFT